MGQGKDDRLNREESNLLIELFDKGMTEGAFLFGKYLTAKGIITDEDIFNARMLQKTQNLRIGEVAVSMGFMDEESVHRLLVAQEETGLRFGVLAVSFGFLTTDELAQVVNTREKSYLYFGEALVKVGAMERGVMMECLGLFQRLKVRVEQMDA